MKIIEDLDQLNGGQREMKRALILVGLLLAGAAGVIVGRLDGYREGYAQASDDIFDANPCEPAQEGE